MSLNEFVHLFLPGSYTALIINLLIPVALLYARQSISRLARVWLTALVVVFAVTSTRIGTELFAAPLHRHDAVVADSADARGATAVVVLVASASTFEARGLRFSQVSGNGVLRALEAARVYHLLDDPVVIVSGGFPERDARPSIASVMRDVLTSLGVPIDRIVIEAESPNTIAHARLLGPVLRTHRVERFVLVTSPEHMWRASATFRAVGHDFVRSSARARTDLSRSRSGIWPAETYLEDTASAAHEYVGLFYYWMRGWL